MIANFFALLLHLRLKKGEGILANERGTTSKIDIFLAPKYRLLQLPLPFLWWLFHFFCYFCFKMGDYWLAVVNFLLFYALIRHDSLPKRFVFNGKCQDFETRPDPNPTWADTQLPHVRLMGRVRLPSKSLCLDTKAINRVKSNSSGVKGSERREHGRSSPFWCIGKDREVQVAWHWSNSLPVVSDACLVPLEQTSADRSSSPMLVVDEKGSEWSSWTLARVLSI